MIQVTIDSGSKIRNQIGSKVYEMLVQVKKQHYVNKLTNFKNVIEKNNLLLSIFH